MSLGIRIFLVYALFIGLTGYFVLSTVMKEVRPGVRQSTEEPLVDTANLLAEVLRFDAERVGDKVKFTLFNSAEPIPDYALPRLSERFYSLPRPHSGRKSTGPGLNFVEEVVQLHGGKLQVGNVDGGVLVVLWLPQTPSVGS